MKKGAEYERFIFEKLRRFFKDADVKLNDKIPGSESGLLREIDVSIRMPVNGEELLHIVQCKDWATPTDINVLGELASVMRDVGASKGILLCTSGFAKSNHTYAQTVGIELLTIEDINSDKWTVEVEIPFVYIEKSTHYELDLEISPSQELIERNRLGPVQIDIYPSSPLSLDGGHRSTTLDQRIAQAHDKAASKGSADVQIDLLEPGLALYTANSWNELSRFAITFTVRRQAYIKYITPDEYSQVVDHRRNTALPLHAAIKDAGLGLDDSFTKIPEGEIPSFTGLNLEVEESTGLEPA